MSINKKIIVITIVILFCIIIIRCLIHLKISDKKFNKELKEEIRAIEDKYKKIRENKENTINRLTKSLTALCKLLNIELTYHDSLDIAAGRILYSSVNGRLIVDNAKIQILNTCKDKPYVLAHELGHYMSIKQREDDTEEGADLEALNLCKTILTQEEQSYIADELRIYFESKLKTA